MPESAPNSSLNRREFLRLVAALGGSAALASLLESCSRTGLDQALLPSPTSAPLASATFQEPTAAHTQVPEEPIPTMAETVQAPLSTAAVSEGKARLALIKTGNRAEGVRQAIDLLGINPVAGKSVFLKPNFNSSDPTPGSTHPEVLAALVTKLQEMGARKITVGDRSGMGNTRRVMEQLGVFTLAQDLGFDAIVFDELAAEDWTMIESPGGHWQQGFPFARPCLEAEALVQTCCLKTHQYGGHFTLSLKNSVGMVAKRPPDISHDFMSELHSSPHQRTMIAEINAAYQPALVVLDGVEAFISGGPHAGERVSPQVILAGTDRVAIDAVGVALLRQFGCKTEVSLGKIFEQEQIARAVELGIGIDSPDKIDFLTADTDSAAFAGEIMEVLRMG